MKRKNKRGVINFSLHLCCELQVIIGTKIFQEGISRSLRNDELAALAALLCIENELMNLLDVDDIIDRFAHGKITHEN